MCSHCSNLHVDVFEMEHNFCYHNWQKQSINKHEKVSVKTRKAKLQKDLSQTWSMYRNSLKFWQKVKNCVRSITVTVKCTVVEIAHQQQEFSCKVCVFLVSTKWLESKQIVYIFPDSSFVLLKFFNITFSEHQTRMISSFK